MTGRSRVAAAAIACLALGITVTSPPAGPPSMPEFWSTELLEDYELPLAAPSRTPTPVSRGYYYYALLERRVFKTYPVYQPDREPAGYLDRLRAAEQRGGLRRGHAAHRCRLGQLSVRPGVRGRHPEYSLRGDAPRRASPGGGFVGCRGHFPAATDVACPCSGPGRPFRPASSPARAPASSDDSKH